MIQPYLPETKKKKGKLLGKLLDVASGAPFLGSFFQDHLGNFFKGKGMSDNPEPLLFQPDKKEEETDKKFFNRYLQPSDKDYQKGKLTRYFVKDIPSGKVAELDKNAYIKQKKENKPYRKFHKLDWLVSGLVEDTNIKGYDAEGIKSKNEKTILAAERALPGIGNVLNDGAQFTQNTLSKNIQGNLVSEEDRLGANSKENLQTKPGQFVIKGTNVPYNGPYHIHPTKGPMVGARHIKAIHPQLEFVGKEEETPTEIVQQQVYQDSQSTTTPQPAPSGGTLRRSTYSSY